MMKIVLCHSVRKWQVLAKLVTYIEMGCKWSMTGLYFQLWSDIQTSCSAYLAESSYTTILLDI